MSVGLPICICVSDRSELPGRSLRRGRHSPTASAASVQTSLLDQRTVMLDDLARRLDALGVDRPSGLGQRRSVDPEAPFVVPGGGRVASFLTAARRSARCREDRSRSVVVCCLLRLRWAAASQPDQQMPKLNIGLSSTYPLAGTAPAAVRSFRQHNRAKQGEFPWPTTMAREREHTTVVETGGGGGGGGVLAVVLLIIVVLVLLYHLPRPARPRQQDDEHQRSRQDRRERQPQLRSIERGRVASPRPGAGAVPRGAAPVCFCPREALTGAHDRLHDGFRRPFRKRSGRGRTAQGPQFAAAARLRALHRAAVGKLVHLASARKPPLLAVPDAADRRSSAIRRLPRRDAVAPGTFGEPLAPNRLRWDPPQIFPRGRTSSTGS